MRSQFKEHSRVGESTCAIQGVHLDCVTEEVRVRKESPGHEPMNTRTTEKIIRQMLPTLTSSRRCKLSRQLKNGRFSLERLPEIVQSMSHLARIEFV
ncbi:hypothetical protein B9Z55_016224 [Caenorhabditis nigoni]|uniref:Uncharacterized protein n=1 Tax=Caenorhabditis nigoni TaxID=1611254 RepID=A0A2G5UDR3_9PELO|nr:hypothetical protein B9Z55_016224 [Caenorhabditis nigoni]